MHGTMNVKEGVEISGRQASQQEQFGPLVMKPGHVQGQCKMGPKNAESFLEGHSSPVLLRELGAAH